MNITEKQESAELKRIYQRKAGDLNLNHHKLAQLMDINQASVSHFINGRNPIPLERAIQFAEILECEVADFSPRLAVKAKSHGDAVPGKNDVVYVDVVLMNGEQKDIIKKLLKGDFWNIDDNELIHWPKEHSEQTMALEVEGAEAEPRLPQGALAIIDTLIEPDNGDVALVIRRNGRDKELVFAELTGKGYFTLPNEQYPDRVFKPNKDDVIGCVIGAQSYGI